MTVRNSVARRRSGVPSLARPFEGGGSRTALGFERLEARLALAGVVINEFLASNVEGVVDQDGEHSDWIELKNTDAAPVDLTGWHLTDDAGNLTKWTLPATTLNPSAYLRVFASDKNRAVAGQELHTNFKLAAEGEYLALVAADGTTVVSSFNPYPAQRDDVSYGVGTNPSSTATETLVGASSTLRVYVPTMEDAAVDDNWRELGYNDSGWIVKTRSTGYDRNGTGVTDGDFSPYIGPLPTAVDDLSTAEMPSSLTSAYIRYSFNLANKDQLTSLGLTVRFDDGFIAYINGREVQQVNFGDDFQFPQPAWNSRAGNQTSSSTMQATNRNGSDALTPVTFDLTPYLPSLLNGPNVIAFHLVNGTSGSTDLLLEPVLTATRTSGTQTGFMAGPTPGGDNGVSSLGYVGDTHFSVDRGFFNAAFPVTITTDLPTASIRYTTDGSLPSATTGTLYTGPVNISTTTVLRAIAYQAGYTSSNVDTQTYIFLADVLQQSGAGLPSVAPWGYDKSTPADGTFDPDWEMDPDVVNNPGLPNMETVADALKAIPSVSLVMNWDDLFSGTVMPGTPVGAAPQGIYITGKSRERYASFEYFNALNALDQTHADIAVEIQGHSSTLRWRNDKLSFQVKFKYPFGDTELNYPLFAGTPDGENATSEFDTVILDAISNYGWTGNNANQRTNARYVTDQVAADLQNMASGGGDAPHGKYVHLYLNGLYWGMYNMHERPDDSFAAEYYGGAKDDYYVVKAATDDPKEYTHVEGGVAAEVSYQQLISTTNYATAQNMLDVDQFIDYMVVHFYGGNAIDWPHNNWYATRDKAIGGKWRFHEWDQEHAFPTAGFSAPEGGNPTELINATAYSSGEDFASPLQVHRNLMGSEEYRLRFSDRVQALMYNGGPLTPQVARDAYEARVLEIDQAIVAESARWGDNRVANDAFTRADFLITANGVLNNFFLPESSPSTFQGRTAVVIGQFKAVGNDWIPTLVAPEFNQYGGEVGPTFTLTMAKPSGSPGAAVIYYTTDGSDPRLPGGGVNPTAQAYTAPIAFQNSTRVQVRIFFDNSGTSNDWSPVIDKSFVVPTPYPVRIVELNYNPALHPGLGDEQFLEFFELLNTGSQTVSLNGVQIGGFATTPYSFASGLNLAPGARIVVAKDPAVFQSVYGTAATLAPAGYGTQNLSNGGESVTLLGPGGETLQSFSFDDVAPWPTTPDGGGRTLEIVDPLGDPASASNWRASFLVGGSPGSEGLAPTTAPGDFDADADVDGRDFLAWQRGMGTTALKAAVADGDGDYDRDVDGNDLAAWTANFGEAPGAVVATAAAGSSAIVPWVLVNTAPIGDERLNDLPRERLVDMILETPTELTGTPISDSSSGLERRLRLNFNVEADAAAVDSALEGALAERFQEL